MIDQEQPMKQDPLIGSQIRDYVIQSRLGEGGMASVYKAYHTRLRRDAAIKIILPNIAHDANFQARFEQEAQLIANLQHPNIVSIYDFGEDHGLTYLVMQYVGGGTLRQHLSNGHPLETRRAIHYTLQMARALHHAHQHGIVHRDVKPQNMLLSSSNPHQLLLSDFGIAKIFDYSQEETHTGHVGNASPSHPLMTSIGQVVGTAAYMAPEQVNGQTVDARTDVYALGIVLYQMLTGYVPFQASTTNGLMYQQVHIPPKPVQQVNPQVPDSLAKITERALAKNPAQRFPSAEMMALALESATTTLANPYSTIPDRNATIQDPQRSAPSAPSVAPTPPTYNPTQSYRPASSFNPSAPFPSYGTPVTNISGAGIPTPSRPKPWQRFRGIGAVLLTIVILGFFIFNGWPFTHSQSPLTTSTPSPARSFTDTFNTGNNNGWPQGNINSLTASIENGQYMLITDNQANTHFPYPKAIGTLPANFTLTGDIRQEQGSPQIYYGLVFYLKPDGPQCYAFVINNTGSYQILRYDSGKSQPEMLWGGSSSAIRTGLHQQNQLQVIAQNNHFSFKINDHDVALKPGQATLADPTYTNGQLGLLIAGPDASFVVTKVQLATT
jgi:serine/threonine protein kinase